MLVLTRNVNEGVWIGPYHVKVCRIDGHRVRLGVDAPRHVPVKRDELPLDPAPVVENPTLAGLLQEVLEPGFAQDGDRVYRALSMALEMLVLTHGLLRDADWDEDAAKCAVGFFTKPT
jgi:carbon storage regulator